MNLDEVREKHKQLLLRWHEIREELEPVEKVVLGKEIDSRAEIEAISLNVLNRWRDLVKKEEVIFEEITKLWQEYYQRG